MKDQGCKPKQLKEESCASCVDIENYDFSSSIEQKNRINHQLFLSITATICLSPKSRGFEALMGQLMGSTTHIH